jgi:hypothetical protein
MMRLLVAGVVVALVCTAHAGGNPDVRIYFDFDPPNYVHEIELPPYTTVNAYVCLDNLDDGFTAASFRLSDPLTDCPGVIAVATWQPAFMF